MSIAETSLSSTMPQGWISLSELSVEEVKGQSVPASLRFADGYSEEVQPRHWTRILDLTVEWLWINGYLTHDQLPVPIAPESQGCVVNTIPRHLNGREFVRPLEIDENIWVEHHWTTEDVVQHTRTLLAHCGLDLSSVQLAWQAHAEVTPRERERIPATAPASTTPQGWISLSEVSADEVRGQSAPAAIRLPDRHAETLQPRRWIRILDLVAEWLWTHAYLTPDQLPVPIAPGSKNCIVNEIPCHPSGRDFLRSLAIAEGVWVERNWTANDAVRHTRTLLAYCGLDLSSVQLAWQAHAEVMPRDRRRIPATAPASTTPRGWIPLSALSREQVTGQGAPASMRFPDGHERDLQPQRWLGLLDSTVEWLWTNRFLTRDLLPVRGSARGERYIINTSPRHANGAEFRNGRRMAADIWVEHNWSAKDVVQHTRTLLAHCNLAASSLHVLWQPVEGSATGSSPIETALPPTATAPRGWVPLSALSPGEVTGQGAPASMKFPDGHEEALQPQRWVGLLDSMVRWLWTNGSLTREQLPIPVSPRSERYIVNAWPRHANREGFRNRKRIAASVWVEHHWSAKDVVQHARTLLAHCNLDASSMQVLWYSETGYSTASILQEGCFVESGRLTEILDCLRERKNLILQGPPGTGKTWLAKRLAWALVGKKDEDKIRAVQFHAGMSYGDFVRGWRPAGDGQQALMEGPLLQMAAQAQQDPASNWVLIIEEINRGDPARILGEMLTLLEADKRTPDAALALFPARANEGAIHLPANLYVIGTMNGADRSLALADLTLRRRFAFVDLEPALGDAWREWVHAQCGIDESVLMEIQYRMDELNEAIASDPSLGPQFRVGHSYVTPPPGRISNSIKWFRDRVNTEIRPLLAEYWFDAPDKVQAASANLLADL